jgi:hypothetical protein
LTAIYAVNSPIDGWRAPFIDQLLAVDRELVSDLEEFLEATPHLIRTSVCARVGDRSIRASGAKYPPRVLAPRQPMNAPFWPRLAARRYPSEFW